MNFLITAGGTREYIDPVRFISNASSGKMGHALALAAIKKGHMATLVSASDLQPPVGADFVGVDSAAEMFAAVKKLFTKCDCLIMAAAVSDYTPARSAANKIKKQGRPITLKLKPTADILKWAGRHKKKSQTVVGFALEDKNIRSRAETKLKQKCLDMIIANRAETIGSATASVEVKRAGGKWLKLPPAGKTIIAKKIIALAEDVTRSNAATTKSR
jgi:phosphopantothenoylcysteine decarboxylase/phosphopantothenate--cysteine ligase